MRCEVAAHHIPTAPYFHQLEYGDVRAVVLVVLHCKVQQLFVEYRHELVVVAWSVRYDNTKSIELP